MKFNVYAIRDVHTGFMSPTIDVSDQSAIRNFAHAVMQEHSLMHTHAPDYSLYRIGVFESESGVIESILPEHIFEAKEVI